MNRTKMTKHNLSIEFFPPKTQEGTNKLRMSRAKLAELQPRYFSVTFGAGGSTQQGTLDTALEILKEGYDVAPHLSCLGTSRTTLREILHAYKSHGIKRLVALRGDFPNNKIINFSKNEFNFANELVEFIRAETGDWFHIEVGAYPEMHPQAKSPQEDIQYFADKIHAGADSAITQYFCNADAYFNFVEEVQKLGAYVPIVPGIMPITNYKKLLRFSKICGTEIPRWIRLKLDSYKDDAESIHAFGLDVITQLCQRLLDGGAPGLHFYTLNKHTATIAILQRLINFFNKNKD